MKKTGVIYCPNHWGFRSQRAKRRRIVSALDAAGLTYNMVQSETPDSVERLTAMMAADGYTTIVIAGGDTALGDALNCLMRLERRQREDIALAMIPNGLLNDFAAFWGLTGSDPEGAARAVAAGRERRVDVGCIRYTDKHCERHHRYFINCVNIGLVAALQNLRRRARHILGSRTLAYLASAALMLTQRLGLRMHIRVNGTDIRRDIMTLCVGNACGYGQTPGAVPYNGLLDVTIVSRPALGRIVSGLRLFLSRRFLMHSGVTAARTECVEVLAAPHAHVAVDGKALTGLRGAYTITVEQEAVRLVVP